MSKNQGKTYIAKTPRLTVTNIRGSKETVVTMLTVSVKKRGEEWRDSETFRVTQHQCEGVGPDLKTAMQEMWAKWEKFTAETFGESIFCEQAEKDWNVEQQ